MAFEPTPDQTRAIATLSEPLCISAGAGSGKTRVLAERFVAAVDPVGAPGWEPAGIEQALTVTFTDKAAGEIAERVRRVLLEHGLVDKARRVDEAWISTIHGLCTRLLRSHALQAGLDPSFGVISTVDAGALRDEIMERLLLDALADGRAADLVAAYGAASVAEYAGAVYDRLRAMGAPVDAATPETAEDVQTAVSDTADAVARWARCLAEHPSDKATLQENASSSARAAEVAAELARRAGGDDAGAARELLRLLHGLRLADRVVSAKELVGTCMRERATLIDRAVRAISVPMARDLIALVGDFADRYAAAKADRGVLDFEDLQSRAVELLREDTGLAARYRKLFRLVMIDEFQDTNEVQSHLADLLTDGTLCTVGDERQSIYGFRYADVEVYREHTDRMMAEGAATVSLASNFRSHGDVLEFVNKVFGDEVLFGAGFLRLEHGRDEATVTPFLPCGQERVEVLLVDQGGRPAGAARSVEADAVARRLRELADSGVPLGEMVVLLRAMTHADVYTTAMSRHGLDYTVVAGGSFFGRPEIEAMRSFLAAATNPLDDEAVAITLASGMVCLSDDGLARIRRAAGKRPLWEVLGEAGLDGTDSLAACRARDAIVTAREQAEIRPVSRIVLQSCETLDYDLYLLARGAEGRQAYANVLKLARLADEFERAGGAGVRAFLDHLALKERYRDREAPASVIDERADAIRLMTVHAAKGLEFPVVVVPELGRDLVSDRGALVLEKDGARARIALSLPDEDSSKAEERRSTWASGARERAKTRDIAEEKRLLYVACTRARELLVLSGSGELSKPAGDQPLGWLRTALGLDGTAATGVIDAGGAGVMITRLSGDGPLAEPAPPRERSVREACLAPAEPPVATLAGPRRGTPAVSHSAMRVYRTCPLRYYLEKVSRIGQAAAIADDDPLRFGEAVHAALQLVGERGTAPAEGRLEAIARHWRLSPEEGMRLRRAIANFLASAVGRAAYAGAPPAREVSFAVPLQDATLVGKMDLLARAPEGALIVDYKTGPDALSGDVGEEIRMQADCYALAALTGGADSATVVFVAVETGSDAAPGEVSFTYSARDGARLLADVQAQANALESGPFEPLASYEPSACAGCSAAGVICPVRQPARTTQPGTARSLPRRSGPSPLP